MKNKLHIFTEDTGIYNRYLDELIDSIFYPLKSNFKDFDIDINIISDKDYFSENDEYNEFIK